MSQIIDFFLDVKPREIPSQERAEIEARDRAFRFLESHHAGQKLKVGHHTFRVYRVRGSEVYLIKGAGRKLYKLEVVNFSPLTIDVIEVSGGSGTPLGKKSIAKFQPQGEFGDAGDLWAEAGMSCSSKKEKAEFWRDYLLSALDDFINGNPEGRLALVPVVKDLPKEFHEILTWVLVTDYTHVEKIGDEPFRELEEQISHASVDQIIQYGEAYFKSK